MYRTFRSFNVTHTRVLHLAIEYRISHLTRILQLPYIPLLALLSRALYLCLDHSALYRSLHSCLLLSFIFHTTHFCRVHRIHVSYLAFVSYSTRMLFTRCTDLSYLALMSTTSHSCLVPCARVLQHALVNHTPRSCTGVSHLVYCSTRLLITRRDLALASRTGVSHLALAVAYCASHFCLKPVMYLALVYRTCIINCALVSCTQLSFSTYVLVFQALLSCLAAHA